MFEALYFIGEFLQRCINIFAQGIVIPINHHLMQYSLYELYSQSHLDLYGVRKHFIERFYCLTHGRNDVEKVLKTIISSSKIDSIMEESSRRGVVPTHTDYLSTICSMLKFMFSSNDTQILAAISAAVRWDIEVNSKLDLVSQEELKQEMIKVFRKYDVYKEMTEKEYHWDEGNIKEDSEPQRVSHLETWSLIAFSKQFGKLKVEEFANRVTGDIFHSCVFTKGHNKTFASFSSKLGELSMEKIEEMKGELVVVKLPTGRYCLAKSGR